jgi:multiple sugar transport system permease protein
MRLSDTQFALLMIAPCAVLSVGMILYPVVYSFFISLSSINIASWQFRFVGADNYLRVLQDPRVSQSLAISFQFIFESTALCLVLGLGLALVLNSRFKGRGLLRALVILPWAVSEYSTAVVWRYMSSPAGGGLFNNILYNLGLISGYMSIINTDTALHILAVAYSWRLAPLGALFLLAALQVIPEEQYSAAKLDGAGPVRRFRYVTLPYIRYSLMIIAALTTLMAGTATDIVMMLTAGGPAGATRTLTYDIYLDTFYRLDLGYGAAVSFVLIGLVVILGTTYFALLTRRKA